MLAILCFCCSVLHRLLDIVSNIGTSQFADVGWSQTCAAATAAALALRLAAESRTLPG